MAVEALRGMRKLTLIAVIFIVVALLAIPLTTYAAGSQPITRQFSPSANAAVTSNAGDNDGFETTPGNAYADDSTFAVDTDSGVKINSVAINPGTDKHNYYSYSMSTIPSGSTINGITVRADIAVDNTKDAPFTAIRLSWNGGTTWTAVQQQALSQTAEKTYTYGGSADTWGRAWSGSELTDTNFRVQVINGEAKDANSVYDFSLDWIPVSITFTPIWDSYSDMARSSQVDTFSGSTNIVYMKGTGFLDGTQTYNVSYYDGGGNKMVKDAGIALVNVVSGRGDLGNTSEPYEPTYPLTSDPTAAPGTWHAVAQPSGATAFPSTYAALTAAPNTYELIADDTFTVEASAIPEFPAVIAAIGVAGLCAGIYFWMRKRRLAYVKA